MRLRIAGIVAVVLGIAAVGILVAPSVYGQSRPGRVEIQTAPHLEVFGGSSIGVSVDEVAESDVARLKLTAPGGALIENVREGTPAAKAGLKANDVVVEFDGERVRSAAQFSRLIRETPSGRAVKMTVMRDGQKTTVEITPESRSVWSSSSLDLGPGIADMVRDRVDNRVWERLNDRLGNLGREFEFKFNPDDWRLDNRDFAFEFGGTPLLNRGRLGITMQSLNPQLADYFGTKSGVLVTNVREGSPAASAGLKAGDVITAIGSQTVDQIADITRAVADAKDGDLTITVMRDRKELTLKTKLEPNERRSRRVIRMV